MMIGLSLAITVSAFGLRRAFASVDSRLHPPQRVVARLGQQLAASRGGIAGFASSNLTPVGARR